MPDYVNFRQRLDAVLRTLDVQQVSQFLVAEDQWSVGTPSNPEFAMWMMIAGSPTLRDLHTKAYDWLVSHGHEAEAEAVSGKKSGAGSTRKPAPAHNVKRTSQATTVKQRLQGSSGNDRTK